MMPGVGVAEQQYLTARHAVPLHHRPLLAEPSRGKFFAPNQAKPSARLPGPGEPLHHRGGPVGGAVVHHDDFDRLVRRREHRPDARFDVRRLVAGGDDHRDERPVDLRSIARETGAAGSVAGDREHQKRDVPGRNQPRHLSFSPSTPATAAAPVRCPATFVMVRNMSGTRSSPMSRVIPESGSPVDANAGMRLTTLADGTAATVRDARNTAAPAWSISGTPNSMP